MRAWLPRAYAYEHTMCFFDGEAEGRAFCFEWGSLLVEIVFARRTRTLD